MKITKKRYYEQAFQYVENLIIDDRTKGKFLERNKFYIIDEGYYTECSDDDEDYGVYNCICAVLFPYAVDYYKKTGKWNEESFHIRYVDALGYTFLEQTTWELLKAGYRFKIDIQDLQILSDPEDDYDGYFSQEIVDWLIANDCIFEGDCDYTPNFDIEL